jgi:hypothetical protein
LNCMRRAIQKDRRAAAGLALAVLLLTFQPRAWTQYPGIAPPFAGSTLGQNLRNAAVPTQNQAIALRTAAENWARRAESLNYGDADLRQDLNNVEWHFQALRGQFNMLGGLALQLGRPKADNAVAELDAGLNVIAELFVFLTDQYAAGTLDRATVARTAHVFQTVIREWEQQLRKDSSRLGLAW